jgi:hypothetical protein
MAEQSSLSRSIMVLPRNIISGRSGLLSAAEVFQHYRPEPDMAVKRIDTAWPCLAQPHTSITFSWKSGLVELS